MAYRQTDKKMTATEILTRALNEAEVESDRKGIEILEDAVREAITVIRDENYDAFDKGWNASAADR